MSKKDLALKQALDQITTSFGKGSIMWLGRTVSPKQVPVVSTGSFSLDTALGIGGLPKVKKIIMPSPPVLGIPNMVNTNGDFKHLDSRYFMLIMF